MARLTGVLMRCNDRYLRREAQLIDKYGEDEGVLAVRMMDDVELGNAAGAARTCAVLATALGTVIQAELAYFYAASRDGRATMDHRVVDRRPKPDDRT